MFSWKFLDPRLRTDNKNRALHFDKKRTFTCQYRSGVMTWWHSYLGQMSKCPTAQSKVSCKGFIYFSQFRHMYRYSLLWKLNLFCLYFFFSFWYHNRITLIVSMKKQKKKTNAEKRHEVCCDDYLVICKTSSSIMSSLIKCNIYTTVQIQIAIIKQTTIVRYKQEKNIINLLW